MRRLLLIVESHPVQYHAPVYQELAARGIQLLVVYGSDFSVHGYTDAEFDASFAWDMDITTGYDLEYLCRVKDGGSVEYVSVSSCGLYSIIKKRKPAAVLLCGYASKFDRGAICSALLSRIPILFRAENTSHAVDRTRFKHAIRNMVLAILFRRFSKLLFIGIRSRVQYEELGIRADRLEYSPYCVSTRHFHLSDSNRRELRTITRTSLNISDRDILILYSGKLSYRKGVDLIIESIRSLPYEFRSRFVLGFLGEGALRKELDVSLHRAGIDRAFFFGFQNQKFLSSYYHAADLLVLPSRHSETWGLVVNEALHHGIPCVVSTVVGSAPDLVLPGQTGEIFANDDPNDLSMAICRCLRLIRLPRTRLYCLNLIANFTVGHAADGIIRAFKSINNKSSHATETKL